MFTENTEKLSKYSKRILTARVVIYVLAGLCLLIAVFGFVSGIYVGADSDSKTVVYSFGGMGLLYLILGLLSITKPYAPILIAAIINVFLFFSLIISLITITNLYQGIIFLIVPFIQFFPVIFLIRGAIYASKLQKLILKD